MKHLLEEKASVGKKFTLVLSRFKRSIYFTILYVIFFVGLVFSLFKTDLFSIMTVSCKTQFGPCNLNEESVISKLKGKNFFIFQAKEVKDSLYQDFTNKDIFIERVFPSKVVVVIIKRKPVIAMKLDASLKGIFLVDREGMVVGFTESSALPVLTLKKGTDQMVIGKYLSEETKNAAEVYVQVFATQKVKSGLLDKDKLAIELEEGILVNFPLSKDSQALVGALQLILVRSRIDNKLPKEIDLRYSNPVLRY